MASVKSDPSRAPGTEQTPAERGAEKPKGELNTNFAKPAGKAPEERAAQKQAQQHSAQHAQQVALEQEHRRLELAGAFPAMAPQGTSPARTSRGESLVGTEPPSPHEELITAQQSKKRSRRYHRSSELENLAQMLASRGLDPDPILIELEKTLDKAARKTTLSPADAHNLAHELMQNLQAHEHFLQLFIRSDTREAVAKAVTAELAAQSKLNPADAEKFKSLFESEIVNTAITLLERRGPQTSNSAAENAIDIADAYDSRRGETTAVYARSRKESGGSAEPIQIRAIENSGETPRERHEAKSLERVAAGKRHELGVKEQRKHSQLEDKREDFKRKVGPIARNFPGVNFQFDYANVPNDAELAALALKLSASTEKREQIRPELAQGALDAGAAIAARRGLLLSTPKTPERERELGVLHEYSSGISSKIVDPALAAAFTAVSRESEDRARMEGVAGRIVALSWDAGIKSGRAPGGAADDRLRDFKREQLDLFDRHPAFLAQVLSEEQRVRAEGVSKLSQVDRALTTIRESINANSASSHRSIVATLNGFTEDDMVLVRARSQEIRDTSPKTGPAHLREDLDKFYASRSEAERTEVEKLYLKGNGAARLLTHLDHSELSKVAPVIDRSALAEAVNTQSAVISTSLALHQAVHSGERALELQRMLGDLTAEERERRLAQYQGTFGRSLLEEATLATNLSKNAQTLDLELVRRIISGTPTTNEQWIEYTMARVSEAGMRAGTLQGAEKPDNDQILIARVGIERLTQDVATAIAPSAADARTLLQEFSTTFKVAELGARAQEIERVLKEREREIEMERLLAEQMNRLPGKAELLQSKLDDYVKKQEELAARDREGPGATFFSPDAIKDMRHAAQSDAVRYSKEIHDAVSHAGSGLNGQLVFGLNDSSERFFDAIESLSGSAERKMWADRLYRAAHKGRSVLDDVERELKGAERDKGRALLAGDTLALQAADMQLSLEGFSGPKNPQRIEEIAREVSANGTREQFEALFIERYGSQHLVTELRPAVGRAIRTQAKTLDQVLQASALKQGDCEVVRALFKGKEEQAHALRIHAEFTRDEIEPTKAARALETTWSLPEATRRAVLEEYAQIACDHEKKIRSRMRKPSPIDGRLNDPSTALLVAIERQTPEIQEWLTGIVKGSHTDAAVGKLSYALKQGDATLAREVYQIASPQLAGSPELGAEQLSKETQRRAAIDARYTELHGAIEPAITASLGREKAALLNAVRTNGQLSRAELLWEATLGQWGTNEAQVRRVLANLSKKEVEELSRELKEFCKRNNYGDKDLRKMLSSELSGEDWFDASEALRGRAETLEQKVGAVVRRQSYETSGWLNHLPLTGTALQFIPGRSDMDRLSRELQATAAEEKKRALTPEEIRNVERSVARFYSASETHRMIKNVAADTIADVGAGVVLIGGTVAITVGTGGTGTAATVPLWAAYLGTGAVALGGRAAVKSGIKGSGYGSEEFSVDVAKTGVDVALLRVGTAVGGKVSQTLMEKTGERALRAGAIFEAKNGARLSLENIGEQGVKQLVGQSVIQGKIVPRVAHGMVVGAVDGGATAPLQVGAYTALNDGTWERGIGHGLQQVGAAGYGGFYHGIAFGSVMGAAFSLKTPKTVRKELSGAQKERLSDTEEGARPYTKTQEAVEAVKERIPFRDQEKMRVGDVMDREMGSLKIRGEVQGSLSRQEINEARVMFTEEKALKAWIKKHKVGPEGQKELLDRLQHQRYVTEAEAWSLTKFDPHYWNPVQIKSAAPHPESMGGAGSGGGKAPSAPRDPGPVSPQPSAGPNPKPPVEGGSGGGTIELRPVKEQVDLLQREAAHLQQVLKTGKLSPEWELPTEQIPAVQKRIEQIKLELKKLADAPADAVTLHVHSAPAQRAAQAPQAAAEPVSPPVSRQSAATPAVAEGTTPSAPPTAEALERQIAHLEGILKTGRLSEKMELHPDQIPAVQRDLAQLREQLSGPRGGKTAESASTVKASEPVVRIEPQSAPVPGDRAMSRAEVERLLREGSRGELISSSSPSRSRRNSLGEPGEGSSGINRGRGNLSGASSKDGGSPGVLTVEPPKVPGLSEEISAPSLSQSARTPVGVSAPASKSGSTKPAAPSESTPFSGGGESGGFKNSLSDGGVAVLEKPKVELRRSVQFDDSPDFLSDRSLLQRELGEHQTSRLASPPPEHGPASGTSRRNNAPMAPDSNKGVTGSARDKGAPLIVDRVDPALRQHLEAGHATVRVNPEDGAITIVERGEPLLRQQIEAGRASVQVNRRDGMVSIIGKEEALPRPQAARAPRTSPAEIAPTSAHARTAEIAHVEPAPTLSPSSQPHRPEQPRVSPSEAPQPLPQRAPEPQPARKVLLAERPEVSPELKRLFETPAPTAGGVVTLPKPAHPGVLTAPLALPIPAALPMALPHTVTATSLLGVQLAEQMVCAAQSAEPDLLAFQCVLPKEASSSAARAPKTLTAKMTQPEEEFGYAPVGEANDPLTKRLSYRTHDEKRRDDDDKRRRAYIALSERKKEVAYHDLDEKDRLVIKRWWD